MIEGDLADGQTPTTVLDQLLDSQERLTSSELVFSQAELELKSAEVGLLRTMGTLLIHRNVNLLKEYEGDRPQMRIGQSQSSPNQAQQFEHQQQPTAPQQPMPQQQMPHQQMPQQQMPQQQIYQQPINGAPTPAIPQGIPTDGVIVFEGDPNQSFGNNFQPADNFQPAGQVVNQFQPAMQPLANSFQPPGQPMGPIANQPIGNSFHPAQRPTGPVIELTDPIGLVVPGGNVPNVTNSQLPN